MILQRYVVSVMPVGDIIQIMRVTYVRVVFICNLMNLQQACVRAVSLTKFILMKIVRFLVMIT